MIPNFFHRHQSWKRHVAHAGFWALLVLAGLIYAGIVKVAAYDGYEWFLASLGLLSMVALLTPWLFFQYLPGFRGKGEVIVTGRFELIITVCLALGWAGSLGLFRAGWGYDTLVHVVSCAALAYIYALTAARVRPDLIPRPATLIVVVCVLTIGSGAINELFEWGGDRLIGTSMYGELGEPNDTEVDFIGNAIGFLIGSMVGYLSIGTKRV